MRKKKYTMRLISNYLQSVAVLITLVIDSEIATNNISIFVILYMGFKKNILHWPVVVLILIYMYVKMLTI